MPRASLVLFTAFTVWVTIGMPAKLPSESVFDKNLSRKCTSPFSNLTALARSIKCGKSTFQEWGGVYGHLVM